MIKYTKEKLEPIVKISNSISEVIRKLGLKITGGTHSHITKCIKKYNIDCGHFLGQSWNKGTISTRRKSPEQILSIKTNYREHAHQLRRALIESGIKHKCQECGLENIWNNKPIILEIDHINNNWSDNTKENLRFLCPNCHSQKGKT